MAALGIDAVDLYKEELLRHARARLPWSTPEQCLASSSDLQKLATRLGLPFDEERKSIEKRARELDMQQRSFRGTIYSTVEEAETAHRTHEGIQRRTLGETVFPTAAQAEVARAASKPKPTLWQKLWWNPHGKDRGSR